MHHLLGAALPSVLRVWGEVRALHHDPGPDDSVAAALAGAAKLDALELTTNQSLWRNESCSWAGARTAVTQHERLSVVVFGGSVTAGCGAAYPSLKCNSLTSWTRMLHDNLVAELGRNIEVQVWGKNAIRASYFTQCTSEKLPENTNVVLLELQPNLWVHGQLRCSYCAQYLEEVIDHVRRAAPRAAIALIGWPIQDLRPERIESVIRQVAVGRGIDAWFASPWTHHPALAGFLSSRNISMGDGLPGLRADPVHPNMLGHALLANGASRLIMERLRERPRCEGVASPHPSQPNVQEWCYLSADQIPLRSTSSAKVGKSPTNAPGLADGRGNANGGRLGWSLVDEGGSKGVKKLGFLSTLEYGSPLILGPLPRCSELFLSLGVLQSWRTDFGALSVGCTGPCICAPLPCAFTDRCASKSIIVQTSSARRRYGSGRVELENATITVTHSLKVLTPNYMNLSLSNSSCYLKVAHVATHILPAPPSKHTRVRVDSLALQALSLQAQGPQRQSQCNELR